MNKYLEKVAESYSVKGHPGLGNGILKTPKVNLNRNQYHQYAKEVDTSSAPLKAGVGLGAATGLAGAAFAKSRGGRPRAAGLITGALGLILGSKMGENHAHVKALENLKIKHPLLLEADEKYKQKKDTK